MIRTADSRPENGGVPRPNESAGAGRVEPATDTAQEPLTLDQPASLTRNVLYNLFGQLALLLLGFVAVRFLFRQLGVDAFGLILFATTLNGILASVLDLGLAATTVRVVAIHRQDQRYLVDYLRTASAFYWTIYVVLAIMACLAAPLIVQHWIHLSTMSPSLAGDVLRLLLVGALSSLPRNLYSSVFRGLERMEYNNVIDVCTAALQQLGIVVVAFFSGGLMGVTLWVLVSFGVSVVTYVVAVVHFLPRGALLPGYSHHVVRDQWRFSANISGHLILATIFMQSDKIVVSKLLPLATFGYYTLVWTAVWKVASLATAVSQAAFPSLAWFLRFGSGEPATMRYRRLQDIVCHASAIPIAGLAFGVLPAFTFVFSARVAATLVVPVILLSLAYYMHSTLTMPMVVAGAAGHPELVTRMNFIALFTFLPTLVGLVLLWGLTGAGLAWLGYYALAYAYLVPRVCSKCLGVSPFSWYSHMARVFLRIAATYGVGWGLCFAFQPTGELSWALAFLAATAVFAGLAYRSMGETLRMGWARLFGTAAVGRTP